MFSQTRTLIVSLVLSLLLLAQSATAGQHPTSRPVPDSDKAAPVLIAAGILAVGTIGLTASAYSWATSRNEVLAATGTDGESCTGEAWEVRDNGLYSAEAEHTLNNACGYADGWGYARSYTVFKDVVETSAKAKPRGNGNQAAARGEARADNTKKVSFDNTKTGPQTVSVQIEVPSIDCTTFSPTPSDTCITGAELLYTLSFYDDTDPATTVDFTFAASVTSEFLPGIGMSNTVTGDIPASAFTTHDGSDGRFGLSLTNYITTIEFDVPSNFNTIDASLNGTADASGATAGSASTICTPLDEVQQYDPIGQPNFGLVGQFVQVCGLVYSVPPMLGMQDQYYIYDGDGGLGFVLPNANLQPGDWVELQGQIMDFNGELMLQQPQVLQMAPGYAAPAPQLLPIDAMHHGLVGSFLQAQGQVAQMTPFGFVLDDGTGLMEVPMPFPFKTELAVGDLVDVTGALRTEAGLLMLAPRDPADVAHTVVTALGLPGLVPGGEIASITPNPFNPQTNVHLSIPRGGHVELVIYNARGEQVRRLHSGLLSAGDHAFRWNGRDDRGGEVSSATYFARLVDPEGNTQVQKMALVR